MTNVIPIDDTMPHQKHEGCWCGPTIVWLDHRTNLPLPDPPLLIHNSDDCRESVERLLGEGLDGKPWALTHD
jgi:hypothetical protein